MFGAGSDTTASALAIAIMAATLYPAATAAAQAELDRVVGRERREWRFLFPTGPDSFPDSRRFCIRSSKLRRPIGSNLPSSFRQRSEGFTPTRPSLPPCLWADPVLPPFLPCRFSDGDRCPQEGLPIKLPKKFATLEAIMSSFSRLERRLWAIIGEFLETQVCLKSRRSFVRRDGWLMGRSKEGSERM